MPSTLKRLWCTHELFWSERLQIERCRKCGKRVTRPSDGRAFAPPPEPLAPQNAEIPEPAAPIAAPPAPPVLPAKPLAKPAVVELSLAQNDSAAGAAQRRARPRQPSRELPAGAAARRSILTSHFTRLANGEELGKLEVLDLVMGLLEDAHVHDPLIFGPAAAAHFAELHQASVNEWICWPRAEAEQKRSA